MKFNKDFFALLTSQVLILSLIALWLHSVYHRELDALKAETNVIFFNSLEEAKDKLFFSKAVLRVDRQNTFEREVQYSAVSSEDSVIVREVLVFDAKDRLPGRLHHDKIGEWALDNHRHDSLQNLKISMRGSELSTILVSGDSILDIDFDTTKSYLAGIFSDKVENSKLRTLKVKVIEEPTDTSIHSTFVTNPGKLGNILFGTTAYAASVSNYYPVILQRMLPEFGISLLIFLAIFSAFIIIYKNLIKERKLAVLKDDFISNMTHELKTPISVVNVAIEALNNFDVLKDPEKSKEYLDISKSQINRLSGLVDQILNISILKDNGLSESRTVIDLHLLLSEVVDVMNLKSKNENQRINIQFFPNKTESSVLANISQLKSVFFNILDNAQKYGSGEIIELTLSTSGSSSIVEVKNKGEVIPAAYLSSVFDKFFRVPNENLHNVKGFGLGLYNVKRIVEAHGGQVKLRSIENIGTTVTVKIPNVRP